jgi:hypothetical protein
MGDTDGKEGWTIAAGCQQYAEQRIDIQTPNIRYSAFSELDKSV